MSNGLPSDPFERAEIEGWSDRIETAADRKAVEEGCYFDRSKGDRVDAFFRQFLRHSKGRRWQGKPFELLDWQRERVIVPLFGWQRADGTRRFREGYVEVPKKNGKTTLGAGCALYMTVADGEPGAHCYCAATARDQAKIAWEAAEQMVRQSPALSKRMDIIRSTKHITYPKTASKLVALSADAGIQEGLDIHFALIDEAHVMKKRDLYDALIYGGAARDQSLILTITTAGIYDPEKIGWELHERADKILRNVSDDWGLFACIYGATSEDDWADPKVWHRVNPSMGITLREDVFEQEFKAAQGSLSKQNNFKRYRENIWTQQAERWLDIEAWDACPHDVQESEFKGQEVFGGLDLASTRDLTALCLGYLDGNGCIRQIERFWLPEVQAMRDSKSPNRDMYARWADEGWLTLTPGKTTDYGFIYKAILELDEQFYIRELGYDPYNATYLVTRLEESGIEVVDVRQNYANLSGPAKHFEKAILSEQFATDGNPVMRYCADNAAIKENENEDIRPVKGASENKIDGVIASSVMMNRMLAYIDEISIYEEEGRGVLAF